MPPHQIDQDPRQRESWVIANLVLGADGSTTLDGTSRRLSSTQDRERFHRIRKTCDALLIGGRTFRREPYGKTPKPLFVLSRTNEIAEQVHKNEQATLLHMNLDSAISHIRSLGFSKILLEAGAALVEGALLKHEIDGIYLTQTQARPNENKISLFELDELLAKHDFVELEREEFPDELFSFFARKL